MRKRLITLIAAGGLALSSLGQAETPAVDSAAISALDSMGAYLRTLENFSVKASNTLDEVLDNGQKIQLTTTIDLQVRRPNGLHANIEKDRGTRQMYYDGKEFTLFSPDTSLYATVPAAPTLKEVLNKIESKYGITFPLVDLFHWGKDPEAAKDIQSAMVVGPSRINGRMSDHYAFRQEGLDWQIWIAQGEAPLPLKYVITTTDVAGQPQYTANLSWDTAARPDDAVFTFTPAETHFSIVMIAIDETQATQ